MNTRSQLIKECLKQSKNRSEFWIQFLNANQSKSLAEVGVYRGDFASTILRGCNLIEKYYMIDPWRHLDSWNKPANKENNVFEQFLIETKSKTDFASEKRIILQGKTSEVIDRIPDNSLDFAYIDGDHTLRGIAIDLINIFPKVQAGGWIGGDDFSRTIWQHATSFEPSLVFPFAVYFAEAVGVPIYALPYNQFLMEKSNVKQYAFIDLTGNYLDISLRDQFHPNKIIKLKAMETFPFIKQPSRILSRFINSVRSRKR